MNQANHITQDDLYLFSLQFLPENEMAALQTHLRQCADCQRQLGWIQGDMAVYAMTAPTAELAVGAKDRLMQRVAQESKLVAIDATKVSSTSTSNATVEPIVATSKVVPFESHAAAQKTRMGFAGWAGWAVAAGVAVAGGLQFQQRQTAQQALTDTGIKLSTVNEQAAQEKAVLETILSPESKQASLHLTSAGAVALPEARASYLPATGSIVLTASHLNQLQADTTYELWIIPANKTAPIAAGTFKPNASGEATLVKMDLPKGVSAGAFGITIEHDGGATTPTMPIVLVGA